jgi:hypothetical protein
MRNVMPLDELRLSLVLDSQLEQDRVNKMRLQQQQRYISFQDVYVVKSSSSTT